MASSIFIIISIYLINTVSSANNCSALQSYVQITSPSNLSSTLTSSKALFAPYSYYIPPTQLVTLNANTDDICLETGIITDLSNKIVLIFESHGECSSHYKVYIAQQNNAIAVLLVNNDLSGEVINIIDDNTLQGRETTIPMRSISLTDGQILNNTLSAGSDVQIGFGCFPHDYPSHICILDTYGDYWYLDGEYQRQADIEYNGHPIYRKEGYVYLVSHMYIFLHNGNGDMDWYWAITLDDTFMDDTAIRAKCTQSINITEPSLCPLWNATVRFNDDYMSDMLEFTQYSFLNISQGLCAVSDSHLCIQSSQSNLRGLSGTYKQFNPSTPYWFRELDACDTRPGFFLFTDGRFVLYDSFNSWRIAQCILDTRLEDTWDSAQLMPYLCDDWRTIVNDSLIEQRISDETFTVLMNTQCRDLEVCEVSTSTSAPDQICMDRTSVMHGFLEGQYMKTGVIGPNYGTNEYARSELLYYDEDILVEVYIWWFGEIDRDLYSWWVLSDVPLMTAIALEGDVGIYGYCDTTANSPVHCGTQWRFIFGEAAHDDYNVRVYAGQCNIGQAIEEYIWPDYVCVGLKNYSFGSNSKRLSLASFTGAYEINTTATRLSDGYPHWVKPANADYDREVYLYFDGFFGYWQIGTTLHVDMGTLLLCFQESDYSPVECKQWYDFDLVKMDNLQLYNCSEADMKRLNVSESSDNVGEVIGIVLVILFCVCCVFILYWFYRKNNLSIRPLSETNIGIGTHKNTNENTDEIEMIDGGYGIRTDSGAALTTNASIKKADFALISTNERSPKSLHSPEESNEDYAQKKTIINNKDSTEEERTTSTNTTVDEATEEVTDVTDVIEDDNDSQIEDEDEKKDEAEKGIDSRRMSQQMIKAMQSDLDDWTNALIEDPQTASRRYSRHSQTDDKFVLDIMKNKGLDNNEKESKEAVSEDNKNEKKEKESETVIIENVNKDENNDIVIDNDAINGNTANDEKPTEWTQF